MFYVNKLRIHSFVVNSKLKLNRMSRKIKSEKTSKIVQCLRSVRENSARSQYCTQIDWNFL